MLLPFGEYRPDVADYEGQHSRNIQNVVPQGDGYGPWLALKAATSALPAACRGAFYALKNDGSVAIFAGTSTKLYQLNNTNSTWTDVSLSGGTYTALANNRNWSFVQFNNFVIAVQGNAAPQVFDLTSSTAFANLGGSPPQADYAAVTNGFLVLSGLASPNVYRVQWSGLNNITIWDNVTDLSNFQDMTDGGLVRGVVGGTVATTFQDRTIRQMIFQPGSSVIFAFNVISANDGLEAPYSLVSGGDRIFWYSPTGFKMMIPGLLPQPIGKERVDRTFAADLDESNIQLMIGAADTRKSRVYFAYKSVNGTTGLFDKILAYDWVLDRWSLIFQSGEYITSLAQPGLTLEGVDAAFGSNIDTLTIGSFDSIALGQLPALSAFDSTHSAGFFNSTPLQAIMETSEHGAAPRRIFVRGFRPITDAPGVLGSVSTRENEQTTPVQTTEQVVNAQGFVPQRASTRYSRGRVRIPAGTTWTFAAGVEPDISLEGQR